MEWDGMTVANRGNSNLLAKIEEMAQEWADSKPPSILNELPW